MAHVGVTCQCRVVVLVGSSTLEDVGSCAMGRQRAEYLLSSSSESRYGSSTSYKELGGEAVGPAGSTD